MHDMVNLIRVMVTPLVSFMHAPILIVCMIKFGNACMHTFRPAVVTCVETEESENVNGNYASSFRRPPTVGRFRVTSGSSKFHLYAC